MGFSKMRGGMTMFRTVYLKMRITRYCGILVYGCQIIDVAIPDDGRVRAKEDEKVEKYQDSLEKSERYGA